MGAAAMGVLTTPTTSIPDTPWSWLLSSLTPPASAPLVGERVSLGAGLPTVPKALLDKIQRWEFVDLAELLPTSSIHDAASMGSHEATRYPLFAGWEFVRPKRRQVETILEWVQAFTIYSAALAQKHTEAIPELLAYQLTIIKAAQQYDGLQWRAYDTHFRINAAATGLRHWSRLDTDLYT